MVTDGTTADAPQAAAGPGRPGARDEVRAFLTAAFGHLGPDEAFAFKPFRGPSPQKPARFTSGQIAEAVEYVLAEARRASTSGVYVHVNPVAAVGPFEGSGYV